MIQKLENMKQSLKDDYELMREHDERKKLLTEIESQILYQCRSRLIDQAGWDKILLQEFFSHWIQIIENEQPVPKKFTIRKIY